MKRSLTLWIVILSGVAAAQPTPQTVTAPIRGGSYRFTIPEGWTAYPANDGVAFAAPPKLLKAPFNFAIVGAAMPAGVDSTEKLVQLLADDEIKNRKPYAKVMQKKEASFVGQKGHVTVLMGVEPTKKVQMITLYLAVPVTGGKDVLVFSGDGTFDDFQALAGNMDTIIDNAQSLGAAAPSEAQPTTAKNDAGGSFGEGDQAATQAPPPVTPVGHGLDAEIADPYWGVEVAGLETSWRLKLEGSAYVLMNPEPPASVTIQRIGYDSPAKLKAKELRSAKKGRFGDREAWIVDGKRDGAPERSFYVLEADHALVVRFASPTFDAALHRHFSEVEKAIRIRSSKTVTDRLGQTSFELPFGVAMAVLSSPWKLDQTRAGAGSVVLVDGEAGVILELKVRRTDEENEDPFYGEEQKFATTCATSKGAYDDLPISILGAAEAHRYRCRNGRHANGDAMGALMVRAVATYQGKPVHLMIIGYYKTASGESPDRATAELLQHLRMGGGK